MNIRKSSSPSTKRRFGGLRRSGSSRARSLLASGNTSRSATTRRNLPRRPATRAASWAVVRATQVGCYVKRRCGSASARRSHGYVSLESLINPRSRPSIARARPPGVNPRLGSRNRACIPGAWREHAAAAHGDRQRPRQGEHQAQQARARRLRPPALQDAL